MTDLRRKRDNKSLIVKISLLIFVQSLLKKVFRANFVKDLRSRKYSSSL